MVTTVKQSLLPGIAGLVFGLVTGALLWFFFGMLWPLIFVFGLIGSSLAVLLVLRPPQFTASFGIAVLVGLATGITVAIWLSQTTPLSGLEIALFAVGGGIFVTILAYQIPEARKKRHSTPEQLAIPVIEDHVADWKRERVMAKLTAGRKKAERNEGEVQVVTDLHFMRLLATEVLPVGFTLIMFWAAFDFAGLSTLVDRLPTDYRPWMVIGLIATVVGGWVYFNGRQIFQPIRLFVVAGLLFIWGYFGFPGLQLIMELAQEDSPRPWLIAAAFGLWWITWRALKWYYGYMEVTDKRFIIGTVLPFPLPNYDRRIRLDKVSTCDTDESTLGNILGYGKLKIDGLGQRDRYFHVLRFVPYHEEIAEAINS